jgi:hypothetical protein
MHRIERRSVISPDAVERHPHARNRNHLVLAGTDDLTSYALRTLRNLGCVWLLDILRRGRPREEDERQNLKC